MQAERALLRVALIAVVLVVVPLLALAQTERRVALVIGNGAYQHAPRLPNPTNDARRMAEILRGAGFDVILGLNLDRRAMDERLRSFGDRLDGGRLGLVFYAGHGLQVGGESYLMPVDARLERERDVEFEAVPVARVLRVAESAAQASLIFLDACRDNPLARSLARSMGTRSAAVSPGLAQIHGGVGTLVAYATQPGNVALDGEGPHSPFTAALVQHIATPGLEIGLVMRRVRESVLIATGRRQVPWDHSSLTGEIVLVPAAASLPAPQNAPLATLPASPPLAPLPSPDTLDLAFWQSLQGSRNPSDFEEYLRQFPRGRFRGLARNRIAELRRPPTASPPVPPIPSARPAPAGAMPPPLASPRSIGVVDRSFPGDNYFIFRSQTPLPPGTRVYTIVQGRQASAVVQRSSGDRYSATSQDIQAFSPGSTILMPP
ncbi:MAG: peptidase caspase catalytic subunit p20 [Burkholderia sp.]|nr:peptidase caspase catalytic subunit p20 [Burkholderia sp.]